MGEDDSSNSIINPGSIGSTDRQVDKGEVQLKKGHRQVSSEEFPIDYNPF